jgi:SulP family sulfate permease
MHHVNQVDFSGIHMLESVVRTYRDGGGDVFLVRVGPGPRRLMEMTGCLAYLGEDNLLDEDDAVQRLFHHVLDPAVCIYECPVRVFRECQNLPKRFDLIAPPQLGRPIVAVDCPVVAPRVLWHTLRTAPPAQRPVVLDVREPREFRRSHIAEAQSLPLSTLLAQGLVLADDRPVVLVCQAGRRSRRAAAVLRELGYRDVTLVDGGMQAWEAAGLLTAVEFE